MALVSAYEPHVLRVRSGCSALSSRLAATIAPGGIGSEHLG
ncbi:DNA metabolism protein [Klebsiella oxytoca]|nr:DNA metabolism protein [Klebsiella michiganensis]MBX4671623.1 DNA metabolism protein [Klebsiella sp. CVUAS 5466.2]MBX4754742.1 DNA metabolism protein [Klebsiella sp. CVUAS 8534.2]MBX4776695.1 DNA metabolism protein [Klebsiella sp. CVUAS 10191.3]RDA99141.1 DNA metabolism protein [Klebsiella oxytoca]TYF90540.1 DNA metabolism protein [Klebsiella grimontii]